MVDVKPILPTVAGRRAPHWPAQDSISGGKLRSKVSQHHPSTPITDSGYGSTSLSFKLQHSALHASANIATLPVVRTLAHPLSVGAAER